MDETRSMTSAFENEAPEARLSIFDSIRRLCFWKTQRHNYYYMMYEPLV